MPPPRVNDRGVEVGKAPPDGVRPHDEAKDLTRAALLKVTRSFRLWVLRADEALHRSAPQQLLARCCDDSASSVVRLQNHDTPAASSLEARPWVCPWTNPAHALAELPCGQSEVLERNKAAHLGEIRLAVCELIEGHTTRCPMRGPSGLRLGCAPIHASRKLPGALPPRRGSRGTGQCVRTTRGAPRPF